MNNYVMNGGKEMRPINLWDKLEEIKKDNLDKSLEVALFYNDVYRIIDYIPYPSFHMNVSLDLLNLIVDEELTLETTVEINGLIQIKVNIKKEVFE